MVLSPEIQALGVTGLLLLALVLGNGRFWVYGWVYRATVGERDQWRQQAQEQIRIQDQMATELRRALDVTEKTWSELR